MDDEWCLQRASGVRSAITPVQEMWTPGIYGFVHEFICCDDSGRGFGLGTLLTRGGRRRWFYCAFGLADCM